jgi:dienelactone hydrolase
MASNHPAQCCTVGVKHDGSPTGKSVTIAGKIDAYLATPPESAPKKHDGKAILFIPDVIGIWQNSQLLADQFAANGYLTLIPDIFNGDPVKLNRPDGFDLFQWIAKGTNGDNPHDAPAIDPIIIESIKALKEEYGATKIGAVGYCFGAKYLIRHYKDGIDVGYVAHPSFVTEEELSSITGPLSIAAAETDSIFPTENRHKSEEILRGTGQPYQINLFSGVEHGFSVRGDPNVKVQRFSKEQAFYQAVQWFDEWLE